MRTCAGACVWTCCGRWWRASRCAASAWWTARRWVCRWGWGWWGWVGCGVEEEKEEECAQVCVGRWGWWGWWGWGAWVGSGGGGLRAGVVGVVGRRAAVRRRRGMGVLVDCMEGAEAEGGVGRDGT